MLAEAWSAISSFLFPSRTMATSSLINLIISSHPKLDTKAFFSMLWFEAINSCDPTQILEMCPVSIIGFKKTRETPSKHEFLNFEIAMARASYRLSLNRLCPWSGTYHLYDKTQAVACMMTL
jgi:hypothetical protein